MITPEIRASLRSMALNAGAFADEIIKDLDGDPSAAAMLLLAGLFVCLGRMGVPRERLEQKTLLEISLLLFNEITPGEFQETLQ